MRKGANIRRRADGRYEARYQKGRDEQGRAIYACCYGRTYEEAAEKRRVKLEEIQVAREMNLLILGTGNLAVEAKEIAESLRIFRKTLLLDDNISLIDPLSEGKKLDSYLMTHPLAVSVAEDRNLRLQRLGQLGKLGFIVPVLIHPKAEVSTSAKVGHGTIICAGAVVSSGAEIGKGCIISSGAIVGRNAVVLSGTCVESGDIVTAG